MAVWFMRWLQGVPREQSPPFDVDITPGAGSARKSTSHRRDCALRTRKARPRTRPMVEARPAALQLMRGGHQFSERIVH